MSDSKVLNLWSDVKVVVDSLEKDMVKHTEKSNISAGIRVRKSVRMLRQQLAALLRESLAADKVTKEERKAKKAEKK